MICPRGILAVGLGAGLFVGCGSDEPASESSVGHMYGVRWTGDLVEAPAGEALLVEACVNEEFCASRVVLIAGLASASRWESYAPEPPPESGSGAQTPKPMGALDLDPPAAGECRPHVEWDDRIGTHACATVRAMNPVVVELSFDLDLSVVSEDLRVGDLASLVVRDEADGRLLLQRSDVVHKAPPYYETFQLATRAPGP